MDWLRLTAEGQQQSGDVENLPATHGATFLVMEGESAMKKKLATKKKAMVTERKNRVQEIIVWVGFSEGKPYVDYIADSYGHVSQIACFVRREDARKRYQDVRRFLLVPRG